jgi:hypothetical protein
MERKTPKASGRVVGCRRLELPFGALTRLPGSIGFSAVQVRPRPFSCRRVKLAPGSNRGQLGFRTKGRWCQRAERVKRLARLARCGHVSAQHLMAGFRIVPVLGRAKTSGSRAWPETMDFAAGQHCRGHEHGLMALGVSIRVVALYRNKYNHPQDN